MLQWTHVILHHSATRQTDKLQFPAIRRNHLKRGWQDIGYHRLVEVVDGTPLVVLGRDLYTEGSHCPGMNRSAIGWCFVGDFRGFEPPLDALLVAARHMALELDLFSIPTENIGIHSDYRETECPGGAIPLKPFREMVTGYRKGGIMKRSPLRSRQPLRRRTRLRTSILSAWSGSGQAVTALALEFQVDPLVAVVLGGVGLWIHEVRDQIQKAGHARRMGVSTPVMGSRSWPASFSKPGPMRRSKHSLRSSFRGRCLRA